VQGLYSGRSLQIFTSGGEFRYAKQQGSPITPTDAPANQTQYGAAKIRPVAIDGATIFVQRTKKAIRDFRYDYEEDAFNSLGISALAPHLVNDVRDLAAWKGSSTDEINLVFVVNGDGTLAVYNSRREANVSAWVSWTTDGSFLAGAGLLEEVYFAVQRSIDGTSKLFLEVTDPDHYTDCSVAATLASATTMTGLTHLNGESVRIRADGFILTDATVAAGAITLTRASIAVEAGLGFNPTITPMPLNMVMPNGANVMRKRRVVKVRVKVLDTLGLLVNGRPLPDLNFDIDNFDEAATAFTGVKALEESTNWDESEDKTITFTQVDPLPMTILGIDIAMEGSD
jgi:hypothetical protein